LLLKASLPAAWQIAAASTRACCIPHRLLLLCLWLLLGLLLRPWPVLLPLLCASAAVLSALLLTVLPWW
jgi:hypothetical protein